MSINKTNYENYFLLYIDKELSASDKVAVENFVQENTEYATELASLKKAKLSPEPATEKITFTNKALLYRLPEMEASLPQQFKNKLYKESSTILRPNFNYTIKATLISVAALLILFLGYQFNQVNTLASLPLTTPMTAKVDKLIPPSTNKAILQLDQPIIAKFSNQLKKATNKFQHSNETIYNTVNTNPITVNETSALISNDATAAIENAPQNLNNISPIIETTSTQNEVMTNELLEEMTSPKDENGYKIVDTDETDRTIYIANFEIDGASLRGLTRKFNALFKRNKSEK